jgi:hypothetical protein
MFSPYYYEHCGVKVSMKLVNKLWWRLMPGVTVKVKWPTGNIVVDHDDPRWQDMGGAVWVDLGFSSDPNDHYRPWMEKNIGRQGWDWDWAMADNDVAANQLTIKVRRKYQEHAIMLALKWS